MRHPVLLPPHSGPYTASDAKLGFDAGQLVTELSYVNALGIQFGIPRHRLPPGIENAVSSPGQRLTLPLQYFYCQIRQCLHFATPVSKIASNRHGLSHAVIHGVNPT